MVEFQSIQQRGFHNTYDADGNINGFEFRFVPVYYKGYWFTQCRFGNVVVDGEEFDRDTLIFEYDGLEYSREELFDLKKYWQFRDPLIIKIRKPGGLSIGYHDVSLQYGWVMNYNSAPEKEFDGSGLGNTIFAKDHQRRMLLCR